MSGAILQGGIARTNPLKTVLLAPGHPTPLKRMCVNLSFLAEAAWLLCPDTREDQGVLVFD